jgi:hypothetical protein
MGIIRPLDTIIRKVTARTKLDSAAEKLIIIDCKQKKAVEKKPFFGDVKYFLVSNTSEGQNVAEGEVPLFEIKDIEYERSVNMRIKYWASCSPGNEALLATALFHPEHPPVFMLNKLIRKWVDEFVMPNTGEFITHYFERKADLKTRLASNALKEAGLNLQVKVTLEGEDRYFSPINITTGSFLIRVKDYDERQDLELTCELVVDEQRKIDALIRLKHSHRLREIVIAETQNYFAQHVSLEQFYTDLDQPQLLDALRQALNARLKLEGRRVGFLSPKSTASEAVPTNFPFEFDVRVQVQEFPTPITVNNKVLMIRQDVARYKAKGSPPLDAWAKDQLVNIIPDLMFYKKYIDLLLNFRPLEEQIKQTLGSEAEKIGYQVKQLVTVPNLPERTWLEPFPIEAKGTFETRLAKFYVKLSIYVVARIKSLEEEKIKNYLNRQQDVPKLMEEEMLSITRQFLHTIDPERFYTRFSFTDEEKYPQEQPVESELIKRVTERLETKFCAEVIDVIPKMEDTEVITRYRALLERASPFTFEVTPFRGGEPVVFKGKFQVEAIDADGWYKFQSRKFTLEDIKADLEDYIQANLKTATTEELLYKGPHHLSELRRVIAEMAHNCIKEMYGLIISVGTFDRQHTRIELEMNEEIIERNRTAIRAAEQRRLAGMETETYGVQEKEKEIKALIDERTRLGADAPEDQILELDERIKKEREVLKPDLISPLADVERILNPDLPGEFRFIEAARFKTPTAPALPAGDNNHHEEDK